MKTCKLVKCQKLNSFHHADTHIAYDRGGDMNCVKPREQIEVPTEDCRQCQ